MIDALFGSKTRIKLLNLFLNNPGRAFYVREITREVDEQINSVRRELANLITVGIIKSDTVDNKLYYEADTEYKFYVPLREIFTNSDAVASDTKVEADVWLKKFEALGDVRVVIFAGKLVYGSASEVDILIIGNDLSQIKLKNTIKALERDSGVSLDYATLKYDDFYYRLSVHDQFVTDILSAKHTVVLNENGILVDYEKENKEAK
ncbi:MAG: transcriptional regulator [Candidatus Nomurabacteria bacterium]|jgi:predicted transcriptional regulator|nr:transcriptional regulator [Candidatus Nomurabacteria bacterium]